MLGWRDNTLRLLSCTTLTSLESQPSDASASIVLNLLIYVGCWWRESADLFGQQSLLVLTFGLHSRPAALGRRDRPRIQGCGEPLVVLAFSPADHAAFNCWDPEERAPIGPHESAKPQVSGLKLALAAP